MKTGQRTTQDARREALLLDLPEDQAELYMRLRTVPASRFAEGVAARSAALRLPYAVLTHCYLMILIDEAAATEPDPTRAPLLPYAPAEAARKLALALPRTFREESDPLADSVRNALIVSACREWRQVAAVRQEVTRAYWAAGSTLPRQRTGSGVSDGSDAAVRSTMRD
ncbi:hypothetical protein KDL01_18685 [Actinospica durhamensis]|uniref:Uncharacterized protein n=1 Tax=Actinospica durhamensis TaxID=1508375 RepID=A0A941ERR5_9ACTN|nr:hypothetical protein [Actinospica durhamensis]MBR7835308.1 hypothetical protein [Actinospica durhamensis]